MIDEFKGWSDFDVDDEISRIHERINRFGMKIGPYVKGCKHYACYKNNKLYSQVLDDWNKIYYLEPCKLKLIHLSRFPFCEMYDEVGQFEISDGACFKFVVAKPNIYDITYISALRHKCGFMIILPARALYNIEVDWYKTMKMREENKKLI